MCPAVSCSALNTNTSTNKIAMGAATGLVQYLYCHSAKASEVSCDRVVRSLMFQGYSFSPSCTVANIKLDYFVYIKVGCLFFIDC